MLIFGYRVLSKNKNRRAASRHLLVKYVRSVSRRQSYYRPAFMMVLRRENPLDRVKWAASRRPRLAFWRAREETNQTMPYRVKATAVEGGFKT